MIIINPVRIIINVALAAAVGFGAGWLVNGWRKDAELAEIKAERAEGRADQVQAALDDLATGAAKIRASADGYSADVSALDAKLEAIRKDFKNAKPLPPDCRPDAPRVRELTSVATAVDQAIARQRTGSGLQAERAP